MIKKTLLPLIFILAGFSICENANAAHNTQEKLNITVNNRTGISELYSLKVGAYLLSNAADSACRTTSVMPNLIPLNSCYKFFISDLAPAQLVQPNNWATFSVDKTVPHFGGYVKTADVATPQDVRCDQPDLVMYVKSTDSFAVCDHVASITQGFYPRFYRQFFLASSPKAGIAKLNYPDGSIEDYVSASTTLPLEIYSWKADKRHP
jgi:hypothetical protein